MSTRATYEFSQEHAPTATIYIHYDGYPEGAAVYLYRLLTCENKRGCLATRFIRAVSIAELTKSHQAHGDTEYRYTLKGSGSKSEAEAHLLAEEWLESGNSWRSFYSGTLIGFVERYDQLLQDELCLVPVTFRSRQAGYLTGDEIDREIAAKGATVARWLASGTWTIEAANVQMLLEEIRVLEAAAKQARQRDLERHSAVKEGA